MAHSPLPLWAREMAPVGGPRPRMSTLLLVMICTLVAVQLWIRPMFESQPHSSRPQQGPACVEVARLRSHGAELSEASYQRAAKACRLEQASQPKPPAEFR